MLQSRRLSMLGSALLHVLAIVLVLALTAVHPPPIEVVSRAVFLRGALSMPLAPPAEGGGGGGQRSLAPPSKGRPPRPARRVFTAPVALIRETEPLLPVEPAILSAQALPAPDLPDFGDPRGVAGPPSGGPGSGGGYGNGRGGGIGDDAGPFFGNGPAGPGGTGMDYAVLVQPVLLFKREPEYSEDARKARLQGTVTLLIEIDARGVPRNIRVSRGLGLGLDERAVEAVRTWRFRPATRNGKPVPSGARVDVNFRLF